MTSQFHQLLDKIKFIKFKLILLLYGFANIVIQDMLPIQYLMCIAKGQILVRIIRLHAALNGNRRGRLWHHKNILTQTIVTWCNAYPKFAKLLTRCAILKLWFHNYHGLWELVFLHDYRNNLRLSSGLGVSGFSAVDLFNVVSDDFLVLVFVLRDFLSCEFASFVSLPEELPSHSESDLQSIRIPHQCHAASQLCGQRFFILCTKLSPCTHKSQHVKSLATWSTLRLLFPRNKNQYIGKG